MADAAAAAHLCCEVCGTGFAPSALVLCGSCQPAGHEARCHSFCLPGPRDLHNPAHIFTCLACMTGATRQTPATGGRTQSSTVDWLQLPVEVVTAILQHVPLHERFNSCALVCKQWADATAAAPATSLSLVLDTTEVLQQAWETHAVCLSPQLTQLHLSATAGDWHTLDLSSTLPCTRLRSLTLSNVRVAAKGLVVLLQAATCLTQLCLQQGSVHGGPKEHHLTVLANLPNRLQHLVLDMYGRFYALPLPDGLVVQLPPHLTHLHLSAGWEGYYTRPLWSQATAQHISTLTKLKHLAVHTDSDEVLIAAPSGLLQLSWLTHLEMAGRSHVLGSSIPRLAALPALQRLVLQALRRAAHLDSEVFVGLTQLQHMQLKNVHVDEALLARVQQQQHLTALYLELPWHNPPSAAAAPKPAAFSALTSSSRLQQLCLHGAALPSAAWQHIFAAGQQLQQLTYLSIGTHNVHSLTLDGWQAMVQACPALQQLCLVMAAAGLDPADLHLPQLLPLSCLTSLRLERSNDAVLPQLLQLTRLRDLSLPGSSFNDFHVMQLTALQRLTALRWSSTKLSNRLKYRLQKVAVGLKPLIGLQAGSSPADQAVWQQLLECCKGAMVVERLQQQQALEEEARRAAAVEGRQLRSYSRRFSCDAAAAAAGGGGRSHPSKAKL